MKKLIVVVSVFAIALVIFGAGFLFAQSNVAQAAGLPETYGPGGGMMGFGGGRGSGGVLHNYVEQALADKLGMTEAQVESAFDGGKSMYQIVLDKGIKEADVAALLTEVHKTALSKAVAAGALTQVQADAMLQNLSTRGFNNGTCPVQNGGTRGGRGQGGMMGGRWNQQPSPTAAP